MKGWCDMDVIVDLLKTCIPTIVGALIVIIPTAINKKMELKQNREEQDFKDKQQKYTQLIMLFTKVLRGQKNNEFDETDVDELIDLINTINITGDVTVVKALNEYVQTWGRKESVYQNEAYSSLVKAIRTDLGVDKKENKDFPEIGLVEINIKKEFNLLEN